MERKQVIPFISHSQKVAEPGFEDKFNQLWGFAPCINSQRVAEPEEVPEYLV